MFNTPRRLGAGVAVLAAALSMAACGGGTARTTSDDSAATQGKRVLTIGVSYAPASLDPAKNSSGLPAVINSLSNEALFHLGSGFEVEPGLATKWRYLDKTNTKFEFTLRSGARFSDGTPLNAQAVKAWLEYFVAAKGPFASALPIKAITTSGEDTVQLELASPNPIIAIELSEYMNAGFVSSVKDPSKLSTSSAGVGPYVLDPSQTQIGSSYVYVPNKGYYDQGAIHFSKVVAKVIASPTSMLQALQAGQLDFANVDSSVTSALKSSQSHELVQTPGGVADVVLIDRGGATVKALGDVRVRQALNYAIDRATIAKALGGPGAAPTSQIQTDASDPALNDYYAYDPAKAKALLAAAGYPDGFTLNLIDAGTQGGNTGGPVSQAAAKYWKAIGVTTKITSAASNSEFVQQALSKKFASGEWAPSQLPTLFAYAELYAANGSLNPFGVGNPEIDKALQAAVISQGDAQQAAFRRVNELATKHAITVPVFSFNSYWAVSKQLSGVDAKALQPLASKLAPQG